eukprot:m.146079 g.146079  ORF g.146079 m.146079 type:complete len:109 (+) comp10089_c0_seq3:1121-1447(+)
MRSYFVTHSAESINECTPAEQVFGRLEMAGARSEVQRRHAMHVNGVDVGTMIQKTPGHHGLPSRRGQMQWSTSAPGAGIDVRVVLEECKDDFAKVVADGVVEGCCMAL